MIDERWQSARRILAVRLDNLGDLLVTTPAIHAIKAALPGIELTLLTSPVGAQAGRLNPDIDDVIIYQAPWMDPWQQLPQDSEREQRMIATVRDRRFDGAIIFTSFRQSPLPAAYLCYLADIPLRLAASIDGPGSLLTTRHKHPERMMHEVERGLDLIGAIGLPPAELDLVLRVPPADRDRISALLRDKGVDRTCPLVRDHIDGEGCHPEPAHRHPERSEGSSRGDEEQKILRLRPQDDVGGCGLRMTTQRNQRSESLVVIHPGCSMPARTYPWERYAVVGDLLAERLGATIVLTGTAEERPLVDHLYARMRPETRRVTHCLAGELPFATLCALIETADLLITNNTGPMHIAAALKTPVVTLFALTNPPEQWGPWRVPHRQLYHEVPCRLCYSRVCPYGHECLSLIAPEMVADAAEELLAETGAQSAMAGLEGVGR